MYRPIRIVVADDQRVCRATIIRDLERHREFDVVGEAANGAEAVERARQLSPDVVVMDVNMPVLDGVQATREITADCYGVRVVGLSTVAAERMARNMLAAGAVAYVEKGARPETLATVIRSVANPPSNSTRTA